VIFAAEFGTRLLAASAPGEENRREEARAGATKRSTHEIQ
jgi:hypothetical protein